MWGPSIPAYRIDKSSNLRNPNHPKKGSIIRVEPIRDLKAVKRIKKLREDNPRDFCLFTCGINTAYRAKELMSIRIGQVEHLIAGDRLQIWQSKTKKLRPVAVNGAVIAAIDAWLQVHPDPRPDAPLFISGRGGKALTVPTVSSMLKDWCAEIGLHGNYASHTMRKTWGFHQYRQNNAGIAFLMEAFGHTTQKQTLDYLCIDPDEIRELYDFEL